MNTWLTAQASVIGASHIKTGVACQDSAEIRISKSGEWVAIVVSDGAGTALRAEEGSQKVSKYFSDELLKLVDELEKRLPGQWINDFVIDKVLQTRNNLRKYANSDNIKDFNCTLVACLQGPTGGFSIHIGDGYILGGYLEESSKVKDPKIFISEPENGEYANETFFITEGDWVKHLRITPMPKMDWVVCCTDGGGSLAMTNDHKIKNGFLYPVISSIFEINDLKNRNKSMAKFLLDPQADKVTGDDKTLVIAIKSDKISTINQYFSNQEKKNFIK